jgi:hypothetical protein
MKKIFLALLPSLFLTACVTETSKQQAFSENAPLPYTVEFFQKESGYTRIKPDGYSRVKPQSAKALSRVLAQYQYGDDIKKGFCSLDAISKGIYEANEWQTQGETTFELIDKEPYLEFINANGRNASISVIPLKLVTPFLE